jgi:6-phosphogluconate dehydrogenase
MNIGVVGLGKMGSRIAEKLAIDGHEVIAWNRTPEVGESLVSRIKNQEVRIKENVKNLNSNYLIHTSSLGKIELVKSIKEIINKLKSPRIIWMMLPAGLPTQNVLDEVSKYVEKDDIVIDGGNAFYKDTEERYKKLRNKEIRFLGIGVSGGIKAFDNGYPLMVGGDKSAYEHITPVLNSLAKPNGGHAYFGEGGAGHFIKMVHNGIEYGMMQAIGEGFGVLEKAPYDFDLPAVAKLWQKGTIVSSFLTDCAKEALNKDPKLSSIDGVIEATGEAEWTVNQGKEENVPVKNIEQALSFRRRSKTDKNVSSSFAARMVAALRREFGGHSVKKKR